MVTGIKKFMQKDGLDCIITAFFSDFLDLHIECKNYSQTLTITHAKVSWHINKVYYYYLDLGTWT